MLPYGGQLIWVRLGLAALLGVLLVPGVAAAQTAGGSSQQQQLENQIAQLDQAGAAQLTKLQVVQQQQQTLNTRAAALNTQLDAAQARLDPLAAVAAQIDGTVAQVQATISATQDRLAVAKQAFDASAAQLYTSALNGAQYQAVLAAQPQDAALESKYLAVLSQQRKDLIDQVESLRSELETQRKTLVIYQTQADAAANAARAARDQVASLVNQLGSAQAQANGQAAAVQAAITQIQGNKTEDQAELASIQAASDGISALLRSRGGGTAAEPCQVRPVPDEGINQPFIPGQHPGIDLHASYGDPIHACRAGVVVSAGWDGGYGNAVVIDHGGGMATLYAHQSQIVVNIGQQVSAGQVIGYVGSTGYSTGPHLHFEVRINGNPVDPAPYL